MALRPVQVFFSYSHRDEAYKEQLEVHLTILRRRGLLKSWSDRQIIAGQNWQSIIEEQLQAADIVLLLVSADFIASDYCYGKELRCALERHERNETKVIPIVLRPVDWRDAPFGKLQALPKDGTPVTSWPNQDQAWLDVEQGIRRAIEELNETKFRNTSTSALTSIRDVLVAEFKHLENTYGANKGAGISSDGIPTGIHDLDLLLGGLRSSDLVVVAARPSFGKSDFLVNILGATAIAQNQPVAFFSLQMPAQRVILRLVASTSEIDSQKMRLGYLAERDFPRIAAAAGRLVEAPIYIDETPRLSIAEVRTRAKSLKLDKEIRLLMIDSLQQLTVPAGADGAVALKALARELQIPVVITSNISRRVERRNNKRPVFADLEESGNLENEADVILFLYRDEVYNPGRDNWNELDVIVAKNRNGDTGIIKTYYTPESSKIRDFVSTNEDYFETEDDGKT